MNFHLIIDWICSWFQRMIMVLVYTVSFRCYKNYLKLYIHFSDYSSNTLGIPQLITHFLHFPIFDPLNEILLHILLNFCIFISRISYLQVQLIAVLFNFTCRQNRHVLNLLWSFREKLVILVLSFFIFWSDEFIWMSDVEAFCLKMEWWIWFYLSSYCLKKLFSLKIQKMNPNILSFIIARQHLHSFHFSFFFKVIAHKIVAIIPNEILRQSGCLSLEVFIKLSQWLLAHLKFHFLCTRLTFPVLITRCLNYS